MLHFSFPKSLKWRWRCYDTSRHGSYAAVRQWLLFDMQTIFKFLLFPLCSSSPLFQIQHLINDNVIAFNYWVSLGDCLRNLKNISIFHDIDFFNCRPGLFFWFCFLLGCTQSLLLARCSGIISGCSWGTIYGAGAQAWLTICGEKCLPCCIISPAS